MPSGSTLDKCRGINIYSESDTETGGKNNDIHVGRNAQRGYSQEKLLLPLALVVKSKQGHLRNCATELCNRICTITSVFLQETVSVCVCTIPKDYNVKINSN